MENTQKIRERIRRKALWYKGLDENTKFLENEGYIEKSLLALEQEG